MSSPKKNKVSPETDKGINYATNALTNGNVNFIGFIGVLR